MVLRVGDNITITKIVCHYYLVGALRYPYDKESKGLMYSIKKIDKDSISDEDRFIDLQTITLKIILGQLSVEENLELLKKVTREYVEN